MTNVSSIDFLVHVGSQFVHSAPTPKTLSQEEGGDRFEMASIGDGEDMKLRVDRRKKTWAGWSKPEGKCKPSSSDNDANNMDVH